MYFITSEELDEKLAKQSIIRSLKKTFTLSNGNTANTKKKGQKYSFCFELRCLLELFQIFERQFSSSERRYLKSLLFFSPSIENLSIISS